jgi:hypothetical protein
VKIFFLIAIKNYHALSPAEKNKTRAAFTSVGLFILYLVYMYFFESPRKALGLGFGIVFFLTLSFIIAWVSIKAGKFIGEGPSTFIAAMLLLLTLGLTFFIFL